MLNNKLFKNLSLMQKIKITQLYYKHLIKANLFWIINFRKIATLVLKDKNYSSKIIPSISTTIFGSLILFLFFSLLFLFLKKDLTISKFISFGYICFNGWMFSILFNFFIQFYCACKLLNKEAKSLAEEYISNLTKNVEKKHD